MKTLLLLMSISVFGIYSCKKNDAAEPSSNAPFDFKNISISNDTIQPGDTTSIVANAIGENLNYQWSLSHGDLFGYGNRVVFGAAPCCVGTIYINCTVSDGTHSTSKGISLVVQQ